MAEAEFDAGGNEAGLIPEVVADAIMEHDVDGVNFGDKRIDGVSKLQLPSLAWLDASEASKIARSNR